MTLKEKVAEVEPENVGSQFIGGVSGCPFHYNLTTDKCKQYDQPYEKGFTEKMCTACWNREYKEPANA